MGGLRVSRKTNEYLHCSFSGGKTNTQAAPTIKGTSLNQVEEFKYLRSTVNTRANTERMISLTESEQVGLSGGHSLGSSVTQIYQSELKAPCINKQIGRQCYMDLSFGG
ncbi:unnamed protein product, partial [Brenthis ino]